MPQLEVAVIGAYLLVYGEISAWYSTHHERFTLRIESGRDVFRLAAVVCHIRRIFDEMDAKIGVSCSQQLLNVALIDNVRVEKVEFYVSVADRALDEQPVRQSL